jgi:uncharacterized membrane protein (DUF485 family)
MSRLRSIAATVALLVLAFIAVIGYAKWWLAQPLPLPASPFAF